MDYKIFTYEEFDVLVKHWWDIMIKSEFPHVECVPIRHDIYKRRTRNLGFATYKRVDGKPIPYELSFSFRLLDGRFKLEVVIDVIKHEASHHLDLLRNGKMSSHGKPFQKIAQEFGFDYHGSTEITDDEKSEIYDLIVTDTTHDYKYFLVCDCGVEYRYKKKVKFINSIIKRGNTKLQCACHKCNRDDGFTLYIMDTEIDVRNSDYKEQYKLNGKTVR